MKYRIVIGSEQTQWSSGPMETVKNKMATFTGVIA